MEINICPITNQITTKLKIKDKKLNTFIDEESNHGSENFRSICLNDNKQEHVIFNHNVLLKTRERNWSFVKIRKIQKRCKLNYDLRLNYINSVNKNIINRKNISKYKYSLFLADKYYILTQQEYLHTVKLELFASMYCSQ